MLQNCHFPDLLIQLMSQLLKRVVSERVSCGFLMSVVKRQLGLWAEVRTFMPASPALSKLQFGMCIFETFYLSFSWKGEKKIHKPKPSEHEPQCKVMQCHLSHFPDSSSCSMPARTSFKIQQSKCSPECCWFCCCYWEQYRQL